MGARVKSAGIVGGELKDLIEDASGLVWIIHVIPYGERLTVTAYMEKIPGFSLWMMY
jgi:hypothetical protein